MRRADKAITDKARVGRLLAEAAVCRIAFNGRPFPYVVPVNFACEGATLYFHCALEGEKLARLAADPHVCVETDEQLALAPGDKACGWGVRYWSVIARGRGRLLGDPAAKAAALLALMRKYSGRADWTLPPESLQKVAVVAVDLEEITGKQAT